MSKILIIATHPDDETLGCGGTILRHIANKDKVYWLIATKMKNKKKWKENKINLRKNEILSVYKKFKFSKKYELDFETSYLDSIPIGEIIHKLNKVVIDCKPDIVYCPNIDDVHTDHQIISKACSGLAKSFRFNFIKRILTYEVISETNYNFFNNEEFKPNYFVNIQNYLKQKIEIMKIYKSEMKKFPFPRSVEAIEALAKIRGAQSNLKAAEAFKIIKEIY